MDKTVTIENKKYYTVKQFSEITGVKQPALRRLVHVGNKTGKLKSLLLGRNVYIPVNELTEYTFCVVGNTTRAYRFDKNGVKYYTTTS